MADKEQAAAPVPAGRPVDAKAAPTAAAEAVASAVEEVAGSEVVDAAPVAASEKYIQQALDRAEEMATPYLEPLAARAKDVFAKVLSKAETAGGAAAAHPYGKSLLEVGIIAQAADAVAANKELALGVALGVSALTTCYVTRRLLAPKASAERALPLAETDEEPESPKVEGVLTLTPVIGETKEVEVEEVLDSKGRRLILASDHSRCPRGVRVTSFNGHPVASVSEARRAQAAVAPNEPSVLQLGDLRLELEPLEADEQLEKKASPVYSKPEETRKAQASLAQKKAREQVNVTVSPPTEGLDGPAVPPAKSLSLETPAQNGHAAAAKEAEAKAKAEAEAKAKAEAEAEAKAKAEAEAKAKAEEEAKAKAEAEAKAKAEAEEREGVEEARIAALKMMKLAGSESPQKEEEKEDEKEEKKKPVKKLAKTAHKKPVTKGHMKSLHKPGNGKK